METPNGGPHSWQWGAQRKREQDGLELGDPQQGIAYYGNMAYEGHGSQEHTVFVINPRTLLRNPGQ